MWIGNTTQRKISFWLMKKRNALWMIYLCYLCRSRNVRDAKEKYILKLWIANGISNSFVIWQIWKTTNNIWIVFVNLLRGFSGFKWKWIPKMAFMKYFFIFQRYFMSWFYRKFRKLFNKTIQTPSEETLLNFHLISLFIIFIICIIFFKFMVWRVIYCSVYSTVNSYKVQCL